MQRSLHLYNTASRQKEEFVPLHDPAGMYCCGPTVYNYAHIGNLRTYIFEDVLKRVLLSLGLKVKHVVNITDVGHLTSDADTGEDKMEKGAVRENRSVWEIAEFFTSKFKENIRDLNILEPDFWPRATDYIPQMIELVKKLESGGFTYRTSDGIYFDTTKFPSYCDFARLDPSSLRAGERVDIGEKRNVTDFALWKFSPVDKKRQMEWESPWGTGFPGWHIECSAMALANFPQPVDIHCGGADHIRVHHTNEIAQSEAATGKQFARYWAHGEFLVLDKGKMAKSEGNFVTLDTLKEQGIAPLAYRMFCFTAHYRSPLTFSLDGVKASAQSLANLRKMVPQTASKKVDVEIVNNVLQPFYSAIDDDLNMPRAVAALWDFLRDESIDQDLKREATIEADKVLGLDLNSSDKKSEKIIDIQDIKIKFESRTQLPDDVQQILISRLRERKQARADKNFGLADFIRKQLAEAGVLIKDMPDGSIEVNVSDPVSANPDTIRSLN